MYRLGPIARRLVRDDAELGYEFGGRYEWIGLKESLLLKALAIKVHSTAIFRSGTQGK